MKIRKKICKKCLEEKVIFSKGLCKQCDIIVNPKKYQIKNKSVDLSSSRKAGINKISKNQKERLKIYNEARKECLEKNPVCQRCHYNKSGECHHKKGRIGDKLFRNLLALCRDCHIFLEMHPKIAKEEGFSASRLKKE